MAEFVGGFATSHTLMASAGVEEKAGRVTDGLVEIGRRLRALEPEVVLLVSNDHLFTFNLQLQAPFIVGVDDSHAPYGDMDIPRTPHRGHRAFAEEFIAFAATQGFDLAAAQGLRLDHGMAVPLMFIDPDRELHIVPLYLNLMMRPMPSFARCLELSGVLRGFVQDHCNSARRVVVVGAGGLSHWVGLEKVAVNEAWDRQFLADLCAGDLSRWLQKTESEVEAEAGNGGLEIIHWLFMATATGAHSAEIIYYEPMIEWMTGMGGIQVFN